MDYLAGNVQLVIAIFDFYKNVSREIFNKLKKIEIIIELIPANITLEIIGETDVEITPTTKNSRNKNLRKTITKNIRLKNVVLIQMYTKQQNLSKIFIDT